MNNYDTLGIPQNSAVEVIKVAFKKLAKKHHPDMEGGDEVMFIKIKKAYDELLEGIVGGAKLETYPMGNVGMAVVSGKHETDGFHFVFMVENLYQVLGLHDLRGVVWDTDNVLGKHYLIIVLTQELLEMCNYDVHLRFTGYNGSFMDKQFKVKPKSGNVVTATFKKFFG